MNLWIQSKPICDLTFEYGKETKLVKYFRAMVEFECQYMPNDEIAAYIYIVQLYYNLGDINPDISFLRSLTDQQISGILHYVLYLSKQINDDDGVDHLCSLAICEGAECSKVEPFLNTFKVCSRCKKAKYCSQECQANHWKIHKTRCYNN
jgi:hypothetical protein